MASSEPNRNSRLRRSILWLLMTGLALANPARAAAPEAVSVPLSSTTEPDAKLQRRQGER